MSTAALRTDHWRDLDGAIAAAAERILSGIVQQKDATLEIFRGVFYRGRGAYFVGRITAGAKAIPVAFSVRHPDESGLTLDAVLIGEGDLSILFSYTRAYFRVAAPSPYALVKWLRELMPLKRAADLYNAIGFNRHAKTEFYRDFVAQLERLGRPFQNGRRHARNGHARLHFAQLRRRF